MTIVEGRSLNVGVANQATDSFSFETTRKGPTGANAELNPGGK